MILPYTTLLCDSPILLSKITLLYNFPILFSYTTLLYHLAILLSYIILLYYSSGCPYRTTLPISYIMLKVNATDADGNTILCLAVCHKCSTEVLTDLVATYHADPNIMNKRGIGPVEMALVYRMVKCSRACLKLEWILRGGETRY